MTLSTRKQRKRAAQARRENAMKPAGWKPCHCGSGKHRYELTDARGISCGYVCDDCEAKTRAKYRPEIFDDAGYACDEQVEPDDDAWDRCEVDYQELRQLREEY